MPLRQTSGFLRPRSHELASGESSDSQEIYGGEMFKTWYKTSIKIRAGLDISPVIRHRYPYSEFAKGFEMTMSGQSVKIVLDWTD